MSRPLPDNTPSPLETEMCPECESGRITLLGSVGPAVAGYDQREQIVVPETEFGRCEDCGNSLRRTVSGDPGAWQGTGF